METKTTQQETPVEAQQSTNSLELKEFTLNYKLLVNGVPVGDKKQIQIKADNIKDAREQARKLLGIPIVFII